MGKIHWRRDGLLTPVFLGFPGSSDSKDSTCNAGDLGSIPGSRRSPGEENSYPLQYSGLKNSTDRRAWQAIVHGVEKSRTWLSDFHFISFLVMIEGSLLIEHHLFKSIAVQYVISSGRWRMANVPLMPSPQGQRGDPMVFFLQSDWPVLVWSI